MFVFSKRRAAKVLLLAGFASAWPLAATVSKAQIANELPAPPAGRGEAQDPATRSVLIPPAGESEAELPALTPPALTPPALAPAREAPIRARETEIAGQPGYLGLIGDFDSAGIRVLSVHEGGPAAEAGFRENDVIIAVNGRKVTSTDDMSDVITSHSAGDELQFEIRRSERPMQLTVTLGARLSDEEAAVTAPGDATLRDPALGDRALGESLPAGRPRIGIHVATVTDALRADYGVDFPAGALITAVGAGSPADRAGLPAGGVIFSIDGNPVEREEDVVNHIAASAWGREIELGYRYNDEDYRKSVRLIPPDPAAASSVAASGEVRGESGRPLTLRRRVLLPGAVIPGGPAVGRIQRMIQAYGGPYIRFAPEVYVEESPAIEAPPARVPALAPSIDSRSGASQEELDRLRRRVTELEDELAAEKAATP